MAERPGGARDKEDKELVLAFQGGEKSAYDALYRRHARRVGAICLRILNNRDDAEEATQETFLRAYEALSRFNGEYRVGAWLNRIATNVCLDGLRRRANSPQALASDPPDGLPTPEAIAVAGRLLPSHGAPAPTACQRDPAACGGRSHLPRDGRAARDVAATGQIASVPSTSVPEAGPPLGCRGG